MALTLLDYLFHREVQAMSNLSGQGKHGKKQLDPLMIYGIRCKLARHDDYIVKLLDSSFFQIVKVSKSKSNNYPVECYSYMIVLSSSHVYESL